MAVRSVGLSIKAKISTVLIGQLVFFLFFFIAVLNFQCWTLALSFFSPLAYAVWLICDMVISACVCLYNLYFCNFYIFITYTKSLSIVVNVGEWPYVRSKRYWLRNIVSFFATIWPVLLIMREDRKWWGKRDNTGFIFSLRWYDPYIINYNKWSVLN